MIISKIYKNFTRCKVLIDRPVRFYFSPTYFFSYESVSINNAGPDNLVYINKIEFVVVEKEGADFASIPTSTSQYNHLLSCLCVLLISANLCHSKFIFNTANPVNEFKAMFNHIHTWYLIQQSTMIKKTIQIERFLKILARAIEINGPLEKVLYYQDEFVETLTLPMAAYNKFGFLKFESIKDFERLNIFARIHFKRTSTSVIKNP